MSIAVLKQFLTGCPAPQAETELFYFNYDYYNLKTFKTHFPSARFVAVAFVDGWQWHIASTGEANIRPSPFTNEEVLFQGPPIHPCTTGFSPESTKSGVVGILFRLSAEDEDELHCDLDTSYIRHCQVVKVHRAADGTNPSMIGHARAYMHFDPLNTADAVKNYFDRKRKDNWSAVLLEMLQWGVPQWYIQKIYNRILAKVHHLEPVFFRGFKQISPPRQLSSYTPIFPGFDRRPCSFQNRYQTFTRSHRNIVAGSSQILQESRSTDPAPQPSQPNLPSHPTQSSQSSKSFQPSGPPTQGSVAVNTPLLLDTQNRNRKRKPDDIGLQRIPKRRIVTK